MNNGKRQISICTLDNSTIRRIGSKKKKNQQKKLKGEQQEPIILPGFLHFGPSTQNLTPDARRQTTGTSFEVKITKKEKKK